MVFASMIARRSGAALLRTASASSSASAAASTSCSGARFLSVSALRQAEAAAEASSSSSSSSKPASNAAPKISGIVDQIEKLTLLEAADLVALLKDRLNIQEIAMPAAGAAPAAAAPAAPAADAEEAEKPKEKTVFTVMLKGLKEATAKAKVIKEIKALNSTMNLVEAKKFVESAPQVLKEGLSKADAEKLQKAIEAAGGVVELE